MPQVASKTFEFKEAPRPNGKCKFYIYGYPKGKREVVWFRTDTEAKKEIYLEARSNGFDVKVLREVVRLRKQDQKERDEQESLLDAYMQAIRGASRVAKAA